MWAFIFPQNKKVLIIKFFQLKFMAENRVEGELMVCSVQHTLVNAFNVHN